MSRTLSAAVLAALTAANVPLIVFVELAFDSGTVRVTNAAYNQTWNGSTWIGLARLGGIDPIEEGAGVQANAIGLRLSGVPTDMVSIALGEHYQGRRCRIWAAPLSASYQVLADPVVVFDGRMDTMAVEMGRTAIITLTAESRLADLERPRVRRYNDADQQAEYPGDKGLEFAEEMVEKELLWGKA